MSKLYDLLNTIIGKVNKAVSTENQTLAENEKAQARANIGALPASTTIPSKTSQLTNDSKFITETELSEKAELWVIELEDGTTVTKSVVLA